MRTAYVDHKRIIFWGKMFTTKSGRELTYFGREYTADIRRADGKQHIIATVDDLFELLLKVW